MHESNIVRFPFASANLSSDQHTAPVKQLDLFAGDYEKVAAITFFGLEGVNQDIFLASLTKHAIRTIIDLRSRPVFPKPHFDHKYLMNYFYRRSMNYIESAMSRSPSFEQHPLGRSGDCDRLEQWIATDNSPGITACIIDAAAIERGVVASFRQCVARASKGVIEVHPRSLL